MHAGRLPISSHSAASMDPADALRGLTASALATLTGAHLTTARRWLRLKIAPRAVTLALAVLRFGDLGAVSPEWEGWALRGNLLWSPEGTSFTPGRVRAGPLYERSAEEYRGALQAALRQAESDAERSERVAALAALSNAQAAASAALARLAAGLTPAEHDRLFCALDSTRRQRERSAQETAELRAIIEDHSHA